jgi:hypothetical protein
MILYGITVSVQFSDVLSFSFLANKAHFDRMLVVRFMALIELCLGMSSMRLNSIYLGALA